MFLLNISKCILMRKTAIKWNTNNYTGGISEKTFGLVFSKSWTLPAIVWASWPFAVNTKNKRNILHTLPYSNFFCNKKGWWCNFCMNSYTSTNIRFYIYLFFILQKYLKLFVKMQQVLNIPCYICIYFENNKILMIRMINIFVGKFENLELFLYENLGNISSLFYQSILKRYIQYSKYSWHLYTTTTNYR